MSSNPWSATAFPIRWYRAAWAWNLTRNTGRFPTIGPIHNTAATCRRWRLPANTKARLLREGGDCIKGLKIHPFYSMLPMTAPEIEPYLSYAAEKELPVLIHTASDEFSQPKFVYEAAKTHPRVNFIMAHVGLGTDNNDAIELIGSLPNLFGDTAWVKPESGLKLIKKYGAHKLLFGTDNPIDGVDTYAHPFYRTYFNEFRHWVTPDDYELLMHGNTERLYHL